MDDSYVSSKKNKFEDSESDETPSHFVNKSYPDLNYVNLDVDQEQLQKHLEYKRKLIEDRLNTLHITMSVLKEQLINEKMLWKQELEETLQEVSEYDQDGTNTDLSVTGPINTEFDMTVTTDYEERVNQYEEAILRAQAEKKAQLRRQIAINNYKKRLVEVENMCNMELLRVKQSAQYLQPLQMMVSEWKFRGSSTSDSNSDEMVNFPKIDQFNLLRKPTSAPINNVNFDLQMSSESSLPNKFCSEVKNLFSKIHYGNLARQSSSTIWPNNDNDPLALSTTKSSVWSQTDCACSRTSSKVNL